MNKEKIRSFFAFFKKWTFWRSAIFVIILFGLGVGFLWISYYYEGYIQNLLMGLGTGVVSSAIITLATFELMFMEDIPAKVSINEAIEISKKYDEEKAYVFVNGVLNSVAEKLGRK